MTYIETDITIKVLSLGFGDYSMVALIVVMVVVVADHSWFGSKSDL